ncbi:MAG TPA: helix-turn-helix domain-containing protein, partial [Solimonas sp.]|nr:helix-turn-helix domain-containing protein [Solimonas sp.]
MSVSQQRRLEEKERRREEIIDAAERVIAAKGFEAAKMEEIGREARVSRALVYTYFKDKTELYFAICERALDLLRERFEAAIALEARGIDQVAAIGRAYIVFAQELPFLFT